MAKGVLWVSLLAVAAAAAGWGIQFRDVGISGIGSPPDTVYVGSCHPVMVIVVNLGSVRETFGVEYVRSIGGMVIETDTVLVVGLTPGTTVALTFGDFVCWDTTTNHIAFTVLIVDSNPANDTASKFVYQIEAPGVEEQTADARCWRPEARLMQNWPNPFSSSALITYSLQGGRALNQTVQGRGAEEQRGSASVSTYQRINLSVYDATGRLVRRLVDEEQGAGSYLVRWDGRDDGGREVPGGVYFCQLVVDGESLPGAATKMLLVR